MSYGYDEPHHIDMAYVYSAEPFHFYGPGQLHVTRANVGMQALVPGYPPRVSLATAAISPRSDRPSFSKLGGHVLTTGGQPNQMVQHPPLYYWTEAVVLRIPGVSNLAWDLEVWLMRLLSVAFMLPLPLLCFRTTKRLLDGHQARTDGSAPASSTRLAIVAAAIPLTVPNMIRDGSSVTNDSLLILTTSILLYLLSRVVTGDQSKRTAGWIALSLAAALLTKGYALVLPPVVLLAYLVGARSSAFVGVRPPADARPAGPSARWRHVWPQLLIVAVGAAIGGLWWLRNLIDYGSVQTNGFGTAYQRLLYGAPNNAGTLGHFLPAFATGFSMRIWGAIGLPDTPSDGPFVIYGWFFVVGLGVVAALVAKGARDERLRAGVLVLVPILTALVVAEGAYGTFKRWSTELAGVQGRYIYSGFVSISALSVIGWDRVLQPRLRAVMAPLIVIGAIVTNAAVWLLILRSWYQPKERLSMFEGFRAAIDSLLRWSPLPSAATLFLVAFLPGLTSVATTVAVVRGGRRSYRDQEAPVLPPTPLVPISNL